MMRPLVLALLIAGTAVAQPPDPDASTVSEAQLQLLLEKFERRTLASYEAMQLLAVAIQEPDRISARGWDVAEVRDTLLGSWRIYGCDPFCGHVAPDPELLYSRAMQMHQRGRLAEADSLFNAAVERASSNRQRADFYYHRLSWDPDRNPEAAFADGLRYFPSHGLSLYGRAGLIARSVGRPASLRGRFAYWCLADLYRAVARDSSDPRISDLARRVADRYERAAPTRDGYEAEGFRAGQTITASLGAYGSCTTRVR